LVSPRLLRLAGARRIFVGQRLRMTHCLTLFTSLSLAVILGGRLNAANISAVIFNDHDLEPPPFQVLGDLRVPFNAAPDRFRARNPNPGPSTTSLGAIICVLLYALFRELNGCWFRCEGPSCRVRQMFCAICVAPSIQGRVTNSASGSIAICANANPTANRLVSNSVAFDK
jgi:hypothetical protein